MNDVPTHHSDRLGVHTGTWINWSYGPVFGATLTLNREDGALLIGFLAFFVTLTGTSFWRICCFFIHAMYSSEVPSDGFHHQRQVTLRNSVNAVSGLTKIVQMAWAWRQNTRRPFLRSFPLLLFTACCIATFSLASVFSSRISSAFGNEVLLSSSGCNIIDWSSIYENIDFKTQYDVVQPYLRERFISYSFYAQQCYSSNPSGLVACDRFVKRSLGTVIDRNASCPFRGDICRGNSSNLAIDSGFLDSHKDFGINSPPEERLSFRKVTQCAPLQTEGRKKDHEDLDGKKYRRYYFGNKANSTPEDDNYTYEQAMKDPMEEYNADVSDSRVPDYRLAFSAAFQINGSLSQSSTFTPIPQLSRTDADVYLFWLLANGILFLDQVDDDWYSARIKWENVSFQTGVQQSPQPVYSSDEPANPLGCVSQAQICNPILPESSRCTPLVSAIDAKTIAVETIWTERQAKVFDALLLRLAYFSDELFIVGHLNTQALKARYRLVGGLQASLPNDQWKSEVEFWYATCMANLQGSFIDTATVPSDPSILSFSRGPSTAAEKDICHSQVSQAVFSTFHTSLFLQALFTLFKWWRNCTLTSAKKILSTDYANFSVFWLCFILITGSLIILLSYTLEPIVSWIQRTLHFDRYSRIEWCTNETLQLQRLANEELGLGTWNGGADSVPITASGEHMAVLDLSEPNHPRLKAPPSSFDALLAMEGGNLSGSQENADITVESMREAPEVTSGLPPIATTITENSPRLIRSLSGHASDTHPTNDLHPNRKVQILRPMLYRNQP